MSSSISGLRRSRIVSLNKPPIAFPPSYVQVSYGVTGSSSLLSLPSSPPPQGMQLSSSASSSSSDMSSSSFSSSARSYSFSSVSSSSLSADGEDEDEDEDEAGRIAAIFAAAAGCVGGVEEEGGKPGVVTPELESMHNLDSPHSFGLH